MPFDLVARIRTLGADNSNEWQTGQPEGKIRSEQFCGIDADSAAIPSDLRSVCSKSLL